MKPETTKKMSVYHLIICEGNFNSSILQYFHRTEYSYYRYHVRSLRFIDAYEMGLSGKLAAWAGKRYSGHHLPPPEDVWREVDKDQLR